MDPMTKMWVSFIAIGLMALSAFFISFARAKTKGFIRMIISVVSFTMLLLSIVFAYFSIV